MTKIFSCPSIQNKRRTSLRLPEIMRTDIVSILLKTGRSTRHFSAWISEAIINLEKDENYHKIIAEELLNRGENISKPISLSAVANEKLLIMKKNTIKKIPIKKNTDINSKIIRTAITQQLIKEELLHESI